jgi:hypothetical protein
MAGKKLTAAQFNVLEALRSQHTRGRFWLPHSVLESYDGRTINALVRRGLLRIEEVGVRAPFEPGSLACAQGVQTG